MIRSFVCFAILVASANSYAQHTEFLPGVKWDEPPVVTPGATNTEPPSDAIVLFDGTDLSAWENGENWPVKDGAFYVGKGSITTKQEFGDLQVHLEWSAPDEVKGRSQGRGNSGVFFMGHYEVQVLDSYDNKTYPEGQATAIYKQTPPMVNAMRKPTEWNTYDIFWTRPRFDAQSRLVKPAVVTVVHNGVLVVNSFELLGDTKWFRPAKYIDMGPKGPISLQDHGNPVAFRNFWVRELTPPTGTPREPKFKNHKTGEEWTLADELKGE